MKSTLCIKAQTGCALHISNNNTLTENYSCGTVVSLCVFNKRPNQVCALLCLRLPEPPSRIFQMRSFASPKHKRRSRTAGDCLEEGTSSFDS